MQEEVNNQEQTDDVKPTEETLEQEEAVAEEKEEKEETEETEVIDPLVEMENRYLRLLADFDNHKRRTVKEKEDIYKYANQKLIANILPVLDAFELAIKNKPELNEKSIQGFCDGVDNIYRQLMDALAKEGLTKIEALGKTYDPVYHEAIMVVDDADAEPNTIIDELRTGYQYKDNVLRPTVCRVSSQQS